MYPGSVTSTADPAYEDFRVIWVAFGLSGVLLLPLLLYALSANKPILVSSSMSI